MLRDTANDDGLVAIMEFAKPLIIGGVYINNTKF